MSLSTNLTSFIISRLWSALLLMLLLRSFFFLTSAYMITGYMATGETGIQMIALHELTSEVVWK